MPRRTIPIPQPGRSLEVFEGTFTLLFARIRLRRTSVQRLSAVDVIVGVTLRFVFASQVPSCGGGGSLSEEFKLRPTALLREERVLDDQVSARVRAGVADRVALGERMGERGSTVAAGTYVEA